MKAPAFQFYPADFLLSTMGWQPEHVGAYVRLLCYQWSNGPIPAQPDPIATIMGIPMGKPFEAAWLLIGPKFPDRLNPRLEEVRRKQDAHREAQSKGGKAGAAKVWGTHKVSHDSPSPSPSPSPSLVPAPTSREPAPDKVAIYFKAYQKAFKRKFAETYIAQNQDLNRLERFLKEQPEVSEIRFIEVAEWHWGQGKFIKGTSTSLWGMCETWASLAAKVNAAKPKNIETLEDLERMKKHGTVYVDL